MKRTDKKVLKKIAKILTIHGYRNSPIEDIHASGRITNKEMKHLNKTIYNQIYTLMVMMETTGLGKYYTTESWGHDWDEPKLLKSWIKLK